MNSRLKACLAISTVVVLSAILIAAPTIQGVSAASSLKVAAKADKSTITRGSTQTITVTVTDGSKKVSGASVVGFVVYASGEIKQLTASTDKDGIGKLSWQIGGNSKTGTFTVYVVATKSGFDSGAAKITFAVKAKT